MILLCDLLSKKTKRTDKKYTSFGLLAITESGSHALLKAGACADPRNHRIRLHLNGVFSVCIFAVRRGLVPIDAYLLDSCKA